VFLGFDPFSGDWQLLGDEESMLGQAHSGFMDEVGLVYDNYLLATQFNKDDVLGVNFDMPNDKMFRKYLKHRTKLLFTPFSNFKSKRIWGLDSPIELFLFQELEFNGFSPQLQMLLFEDGGVLGSLYDFWRSESLTGMEEMITEADMYFPEKRVAVFCDGAHHRRKKQRERDIAIDKKLLDAGFTPVRIEGSEIVRDLASAVDKVRFHLN